MIRRVRIKSTENNVWNTFETSASTFGELKAELTTVNFDRKRVVVRETRSTLELKDAVLPSGDFTLYLMPKATKSGSDESFANLTLEDIENASYHVLRSYCVANGFPANGRTMVEMRNDLRTIAQNNNASSPLKKEIIEDLYAVIEKIQALDEVSDAEYLAILDADLANIRQELGV